MIFFHEQDSRFSPQIIPKVLFLIGIVQIKKYGLKTLFFLFKIKLIKKHFTKVPTFCDQTSRFAYNFSFTLYTSYTNGIIDPGEGAVKMLKYIFFCKSSLVTNFAITPSLISIYNGSYTVFSYGTSQ